MNELIVVCIILINLLIIFDARCEDKDAVKSKNPLPYFRRQVEEVVEASTRETQEIDDPRNNLVSFFVKNVKEIFNEFVDTTEINYNVTRTSLTTDKISISELDNNMSNVTYTYDVSTYNNFTLSTLNHNKGDVNDLSTEVLFEMTGRSQTLHFSKDLKYLEKSGQKYLNTETSVTPFVTRTTLMESDTYEPKRSCIACNNVMFENCNDPQNKLITTVVCDRDDDLCYSQHTPFGIIDRGCFNVNQDLTTYVCSCNLCNYISISAMPYIFSTIRDWADNVIELSRTKQLRKSVFRDMSCLSCEVSATTNTTNTIDNVNCLEGNIGTLPIRECEPNEICGVKASRGNAYVWRGCVASPLYNYWWTLCDTHLCNYDSIVSIYDLL